MALEHIAIDRQPNEENPSWTTLIPRAVNSFRATLLDIVLASGPLSALAREMLQRLDLIRLDYGRPEDESRHPNMERNVPWPEEAREAWKASETL